MTVPYGFRRKSRISRVAPLRRSDGYCRSRRTTRSAAFPTETRSMHICPEVPYSDNASREALPPTAAVLMVRVRSVAKRYR